MSAKFLTIALLAAASTAHSPAFAQYRDGEIGGVPTAVSSSIQLTRADVRAEVLQARDSGTLLPSGEGSDIARGLPVAKTGESRVTREEVRNAYLQAARDGTLQADGEGADMGQMAAVDPNAVPRTRAEVHAEALQAMRNRTTVGGEV